jgi:hypothetical protein
MPYIRHVSNENRRGFGPSGIGLADKDGGLALGVVLLVFALLDRGAEDVAQACAGIG